MNRHKTRSTLEWTLITLILLVAALLRFHDLGNVPKDLEHDEVATWHMVAGVLEEDRPIYFLLKAKCPVISKHIGVEQGSIILMKG